MNRQKTPIPASISKSRRKKKKKNQVTKIRAGAGRGLLYGIRGNDWGFGRGILGQTHFVCKNGGTKQDCVRKLANRGKRKNFRKGIKEWGKKKRR